MCSRGDQCTAQPLLTGTFNHTYTSVPSLAVMRTRARSQKMVITYTFEEMILWNVDPRSGVWQHEPNGVDPGHLCSAGVIRYT